MKRRDLVRLSSLSVGGIIVPSVMSRLESSGLSAELSNLEDNGHNTTELEFPNNLIAAAPFVYTVKVDIISAFVGGTVRIGFWEYQKSSSDPIADFKGGFGGLGIGGANTWGTAWFNYDVRRLVTDGWEARIQANLAAVAVNVNFWGMHGEVIGNIAAGGVGLMVGVVGGQGKFLQITK